MGGRARWTDDDPFEDESEPIEDMEWPESSLEVDDEEFARSIAAGREKEMDAA